MSTVLPGTQVSARGLQWEVVHTEPAGEQQRFRLRCIQGDLRGKESTSFTPSKISHQSRPNSTRPARVV